MAVQLNHTIVWSHDNKASAFFMAELLGLPEPEPFDPFFIVRLDNDVTLDYLGIENRSEKLSNPDEIPSQHYAFLITEEKFDEIFGRIQERAMAYFADPYHREVGQINTNDGGRGLYFKDLDGHNIEVITRPYGSGD